MQSSIKYVIFLAILMLGSCGKPVTDVAYLQDASAYGLQKVDSQVIGIKCNDVLQIEVSDVEPTLVAVFKQNIGVDATQSSTYQVDNEGNIDFPVFGTIYVKEKTCREVAELIKKRIIDEGISKNPVVGVSIKNFKISVLGEVGSPGVYDIPSGSVTLLEAFAMAGDLTITGKRDRILIIREENGKRQMNYVSLLSTKIMKSPYYHLKQNDIIYVEPNSNKQKKSTEVKTLKWMTITSFFVSMIYLGINIFK